ncbi:MAG: amidohydrolase family protein, partial [Gemmataceae bacterium]|nr:amidohydrolase family protein [Gemmataceae bacterium]MDW8263714.1 amidohydrolase family protein [Gemmataceae bacterium]
GGWGPRGAGAGGGACFLGGGGGGGGGRPPPPPPATQEWLACHAATANCRPGLSPHAPYSVHRSLFAQAVDWARRWHAPLAVHLAESAAELELLTHRSGSFVPFLQELGVWEPSGLVADVDEVQRLGYQTQPALFIHGNRLPAEAAIPPGSTLVCCPRTSEALGHGLPPLAAFHDRGVRIALGTDSLASSPSLSVLDEVRYLFRRGLHVAPATLLRWATLSGAEALGWQEETGSLEPGKSADLVVVPLPGPPVADPYEWLLGSTQAPACVVIRGAVVWPVATAEGLGEGSSGPMPAAPPPPADLY